MDEIHIYLSKGIMKCGLLQWIRFGDVMHGYAVYIVQYLLYTPLLCSLNLCIVIFVLHHYLLKMYSAQALIQN